MTSMEVPEATVQVGFNDPRTKICVGCGRLCLTGWCSESCKKEHGRKMRAFILWGRWPA